MSDSDYGNFSKAQLESMSTEQLRQLVRELKLKPSLSTKEEEVFRQASEICGARVFSGGEFASSNCDIHVRW
ncbi:hypothetical protein GPECTOR_29g129 [Gonium pectorale]|uniref:Uncharacterized protein n=1 Tax=Gonium pectorale TaxID=33097 RepID=A0A150GEH0_GONPE|nr:hypothetical protein GPECTOR_29g129 [Gonium pectorale]|eukprot:KXZ48224.1 hypothetical protein GPECTOR_29g129 [Gonium pectorale]